MSSRIRVDLDTVLLDIADAVVDAKQSFDHLDGYYFAVDTVARNIAINLGLEEALFNKFLKDCGVGT